jgi:hypothetical protein
VLRNARPAARGADATSTLPCRVREDADALDAATRLADALEASPGGRFRDVARTLRAGRHPLLAARRRHGEYRRGVRALRSRRSRRRSASTAPAAFMFPGGGAR